MKFELPKLNFSYTALEPYIDAQTMEIHHTKHHQAYINNLNKALEDAPELGDKTLDYLLTNLETLPNNVRNAIRNNGGGHYNHTFFWEILTPETGTAPGNSLMTKINEDLTNMATFKEAFSQAALTRFGSGWAWLVVQEGKLSVESTPNQDNPISEGKFPILGLDVWEHAYYLKYQNKRNEYIENWWNVVNWAKVTENFESAKA
ncbi:superoxide dismutase [candidate division WWE3 bacterium]|jgi:Fe-Mn family superoxide dismutase|uniref:Superoxide dismutase n=1 Tax=candidate division WWE3 bacterium TaxID=2053526 RepID=A0A3A4ZMT3_UNCKA|nr:MAG: superoxide dismutase [candidate division WWE3 bacterium]